MNLAKDLEAAFESPLLGVMPHLSEAFPEEAIQSALQGSQKATQRWRALPNESVLWLVIGMALMRDRAITMVAAQMHILIGKVKTVTSAALVQARNNLGLEPVRRLFMFTSDVWGAQALEKHLWRGLKILGVDGTCLRIADTPANEEAFGRPTGGKTNANGGYPVARVVALVALRTRLLIDVAFGAYTTSETVLARQLWGKLPADSLTILDRGFVDYGLFYLITHAGMNRQALCRGKMNMKYRIVDTFSDGDQLIEVAISAKQRRENPALPKHLTLRLTRYQRKGFQPQMLISSLLDAVAFPAREIIEMYHERWELEITYDEIKTHTLEREEALRSRDPEKVKQELWGIFVAYNLVRQHIVRFANDHELSPHRVSFRNTLHVVREICVAAALGAGSIRNLFKTLDERIALMVLPPRRPERNYPRHVKIRLSNYPKNTGRTSAVQ